MKTLNSLRDQALDIATRHGFTDATPAEHIALIHSEASEALEDIREGLPLDAVYYVDKRMPSVRFRDKANEDGTLRKPCGVPSEMADIIIRVLHFCGKHNIDIDKAVQEKMDYNDSRPYKHGNKTL